MIRAALLDAQGVYLRMDELADAAQLTAQHLPQITTCDLPARKYRWLPDGDPRNPYGGAFWAIAWLDRVERDNQAMTAAAARETAADNWKSGRLQEHAARLNARTIK